MNTIKYDKLYDELETGDIYLFSGNGFKSNVIKFVDNSMFSHIGLSIKRKNKLYVGHSTTVVKPVGTKIQSLEDVINEYDGKIFYRSIYPKLTEEEKKTLIEYCESVEGTRYERSLWELLLASIGRKFNIRVANESKSLYCSEYVRDGYLRIKRMLKNIALTPGDFSKERELYLRMNASFFGQTIQIK